MEDLSKTTIPEEELKQYVSLTTIQTKGLKRHLKEAEIESYTNANELSKNLDTTENSLNSLKGAKKRRMAILNKIEKQNVAEDPNTLGIDVSIVY